MPQPALPVGPEADVGTGTQVLSLGSEPWQAPPGPGPAVGNTVVGNTAAGNPYGYQEALRRRRRRLIGGIAIGTVVVVVAAVIIVSGLGGSRSAPAADSSPAAPPSAPVPASQSAAPQGTAAASAAASPAAGGSLMTDAQSGLSYSQLPAPWQAAASCPDTLNNGAFPWTDGEYAPAGQVNGNGGPVAWYGEACSGPLPQQYGYTGTADLQNAADSLASTFENAYYNALDHSVAPGQDTPVQVSGHAAWEVSYDVTYTNAAAQGATWTDEQAAVVVVDNGTATPAVFFASVPSPLNESYIPSLVSSLQLAAPQSADGAQPGDGSNGDGDGGDGGGWNGGHGHHHDDSDS